MFMSKPFLKFCDDLHFQNVRAERSQDTRPNSPDSPAWGKLMVGFLMAKLDHLVQEALGQLKPKECDLFAHHIFDEYSDSWWLVS